MQHIKNNINYSQTLHILFKVLGISLTNAKIRDIAISLIYYKSVKNY
jgi:hypothetical protein